MPAKKPAGAGKRLAAKAKNRMDGVIKATPKGSKPTSGDYRAYTDYEKQATIRKLKQQTKYQKMTNAEIERMYHAEGYAARNKGKGKRT